MSAALDPESYTSVTPVFSSTVPPNPLTTIFTPPAGCFDKVPDVWETCVVDDLSYTRCYSLPAGSCYPPGAKISSGTITGLVGHEFPVQYIYSPGVLPAGFETQSSFVDGIDVDSAAGCYKGWTSIAFCTSIVTGKFVTDFTTTSGVFYAVQPQILVSWQSSDLPHFTPTSAPVLPLQVRVNYENSVAAASRPTSDTVKQTKASATTNQPSNTNQADNGSTHTPNPDGLSTGAKAGIGVGVAVGVIAILALGFFLIRNRNRGKSKDSWASYNGNAPVREIQT